MLDKEQVGKAGLAFYIIHPVKVLLLTHKKSLVDKPQGLLDDQDETFALILATKKIAAKASINPIRIAIPYPFGKHEVCVITKDPQREFKDKLMNDQFPYVKKVIGVTKLAKKFKPYEAKRILRDQYTLFMADERVLPMLPKLLGKSFLTVKPKIPVKVDFTQKDLKTEIDAACNATYLHLSKGTCMSVKVGMTAQNEEQVTANVLAAMELIMEKIPGKRDNIQSLHLKLADSIALPIYNALPDYADIVGGSIEE